RADDSFHKSTAGDVWDRLSGVDFMNQALLLAAVMLLWLFPNLIFLAAAAGRDFASAISAHMGLNSEASQAVNNLFKRGSTAIPATIGAVVFLVLAITATVAVIHKLWQTIWGVEGRTYWHEVWQQILWGIGALGVSAAVSYIQQEVNKVHPFLAGLLSFTLLTAFFWLGMYLLLDYRVPFRRLMVPAVVTALFFL